MLDLRQERTCEGDMPRGQEKRIKQQRIKRIQRQEWRIRRKRRSQRKRRRRSERRCRQRPRRRRRADKPAESKPTEQGVQSLRQEGTPRSTVLDKTKTAKRARGCHSRDGNAQTARIHRGQRRAGRAITTIKQRGNKRNNRRTCPFDRCRMQRSLPNTYLCGEKA